MAQPQLRYRNDIIVWRMEQLGWTVDSFSAESKKSTKTISVARTGQNLNVDTLAEIAQLLGLRMKFLFDFDLPIEHASRALEK
jgi:hypothetical protein